MAYTPLHKFHWYHLTTFITQLQLKRLMVTMRRMIMNSLTKISNTYLVQQKSQLSKNMVYASDVVKKCIRKGAHVLTIPQHVEIAAKKVTFHQFAVTPGTRLVNSVTNYTFNPSANPTF